MSIKSYKNVYLLDELPVTIQYLIKNYFEKILNVSYITAYDIKPEISQYSDFIVFDNITDLIGEYLKNYFLTLPETYPFDPYFGSQLKYQIQTLDTNLRQTLISAEINNIVNVISVQVGQTLSVESVQLVPISTGASTEYTATISIKINNDQIKKIKIDFLGPS